MSEKDPRFDLGAIHRSLDDEAIAASGWTHLPELEQVAPLPFSPVISLELFCKQCKKLPGRWEKKGTCNCGAVHMDRLLCDECMVLHLLRDAKEAKRVKTALVAAFRKADPDVRSDEEAILLSLHISMSPRPEREPITEVE